MAGTVIPESISAAFRFEAQFFDGELHASVFGLGQCADLAGEIAYRGSGANAMWVRLTLCERYRITPLVVLFPARQRV